MELKKIKGKYYKYVACGKNPEKLDRRGMKWKSQHKVIFNSKKDRYELWRNVKVK